MASVALNSQAL